MTYAELARRLRRLGCEVARQGSRHEVWENPGNGHLVAVPRHHSQEVPPGTLRKILSELGLSWSDLTK